jgi:hypothetical protein
LAAASAGNNMAARMAMMAITTSSSISVKAFFCFRILFIGSKFYVLSFFSFLVHATAPSLLKPQTLSTINNKKASITDAKQIFLENSQKIGIPRTHAPFRAKFSRITRGIHAPTRRLSQLKSHLHPRAHRKHWPTCG